jgi:probable DNA metabolism protein
MSAVAGVSTAGASDVSLDEFIVLVYRATRDGERVETPTFADSGGPTLFDRPDRPSRTESPEDYPTNSRDSEDREEEEAIRYLRAFSGLVFDLALSAWMSVQPVEGILLDLACEAARAGAELFEDYSRPDVRLLRAACQRVDREIHRLEGLARFSRRQDGLFTAPLEPDNDILAALMPHFRRRFGPQDFAIIDTRRLIAFESRDGTIRAREGEAAAALLPDGTDEEALGLWRRYFDAIDNPARRNPALQRRLMPARYWKYLPELAR